MNPSNANLQYNDLIIRERHEDILALSAEMNQVQTVFRDLATMINDQGEMVEDIESNMTSAAEQSKQGVRQVLVGDRVSGVAGEVAAKVVATKVLDASGADRPDRDCGGGFDSVGGD